MARIKKEKLPLGFVVYEGPSLFDNGSPIAVIVNTLEKSDNDKTGNMPQAWIIRADKKPSAAANDGTDNAICGHCAFKGATSKSAAIELSKLLGFDVGVRECYVTLFRAPRAVYTAYRRGSYTRATPEHVNTVIRSLGGVLRIGAYGDPLAVPIDIWRRLAIGLEARHTGYTQGWSYAYQEGSERLLMASCKTSDERALAKAKGFRTFRALRPHEVLEPGEILCPASKEAGYRSNCHDCKLCNGKTGVCDCRKDIGIYTHGMGVVTMASLRRKGGNFSPSVAV